MQEDVSRSLRGPEKGEDTEQNQVSEDRCHWLCEPDDECLVDCCHWPIRREVVLPEQSEQHR